MGRVSTKKNKNLYQKRREELGLSREAASELLESIPPERLERIENEKSLPHPDEIVTMADAYRMPSLCNYYCAHDCLIGKRYVPEIEVKDLSRIVLEMVASLNSMNHKQEKLIAITADGEIGDHEIEDFIEIQDELEKISIAVESMQLWAEQMLADGKINKELYNARKAKAE